MLCYGDESPITCGGGCLPQAVPLSGSFTTGTFNEDDDSGGRRCKHRNASYLAGYGGGGSGGGCDGKFCHLCSVLDYSHRDTRAFCLECAERRAAAKRVAREVTAASTSPLLNLEAGVLDIIYVALGRAVQVDIALTPD